MIEEATRLLAGERGPGRLEYGIDDEAARGRSGCRAGAGCRSTWTSRAGDLWEAILDGLERQRPAVLLTWLRAGGAAHALIDVDERRVRAADGGAGPDAAAGETDTVVAACEFAAAAQESALLAVSGEETFAHLLPRPDELLIVGAGPRRRAPDRLRPRGRLPNGGDRPAAGVRRARTVHGGAGRAGGLAGCGAERSRRCGVADGGPHRPGRAVGGNRRSGAGPVGDVAGVVGGARDDRAGLRGGGAPRRYAGAGGRRVAGAAPAGGARAASASGSGGRDGAHHAPAGDAGDTRAAGVGGAARADAGAAGRRRPGGPGAAGGGGGCDFRGENERRERRVGGAAGRARRAGGEVRSVSGDAQAA